MPSLNFPISNQICCGNKKKGQAVVSRVEHQSVIAVRELLIDGQSLLFSVDSEITDLYGLAARVEI
jgi:hypothetical protein